MNVMFVRSMNLDTHSQQSGLVSHGNFLPIGLELARDIIVKPNTLSLFSRNN